jgi:hypothetical protein
MSVAKVIEITSASTESFEDAVRAGVAKASETVRNVKGVWVSEQTATVENGKVTEFRVTMRVSFLLD